MKKTAPKPVVAKSPTPEKKKPAVKAAPVVKAAKPAKAAVKPAAAPVAPAAKPIAAPVAKPAKISPSPKAKAKPDVVTTTIIASVDVGFGNHITIRGTGPGLSWDVGLPLDCVADDRWSITLPETSQPIVCKFLLNDNTWCAGEDYTVLPGSSVVLSPSF
jgi:hypothetical protein